MRIRPAKGSADRAAIDAVHRAAFNACIAPLMRAAGCTALGLANYLASLGWANGDGAFGTPVFEDLDALATNFNKPMEYYIARRPQFMDFCERYGLVARWVHRENCGSLPFPDDEEGRALAAACTPEYPVSAATVGLGCDCWRDSDGRPLLRTDNMEIVDQVIRVFKTHGDSQDHSVIRHL